MALPTTFSDNELEAVNQILGAVGQAPVTTIDETNPEVSLAYTTLIKVSKEVQAEGWVFNTEYKYPLKPDASGYINIPSNMFSVDLSRTYGNTNFNTVIRNHRLYDKLNHTFIWDTRFTYEGDVVWYFPFEDLPQPVAAYVTARAAVLSSTQLVGDESVFQQLQNRESQTRAVMIEDDCNQGDFSIFGFPRGSSYYVSYQPYQALAR